MKLEGHGGKLTLGGVSYDVHSWSFEPSKGNRHLLPLSVAAMASRIPLMMAEFEADCWHERLKTMVENNRPILEVVY